MSYFSTPYKYGKKTKNQIGAITTSILEVGDNVYNTTIDKEEFWTGNTWINEDCIEVTNVSGDALVEGQLVSISSLLTAATTPSVILSDNTTDSFRRCLGPIYRGGANNANVVVAMKGFYKVRFVAGTSVTRQNIAIVSPSANAGDAGTTGTKTGTSGSIGVIGETYAVLPADRLVLCWLSVESF